MARTPKKKTRKAARDTSRKNTSAAQSLAKSRTRKYIEKYGLRRAAERLGVTSTTLRTWLKKQIPSKQIKAAQALGKPGGPYVFLRGTSLKALVDKIGLRKASALTGITQRELKTALEKRPASRIKFDRERLKKILQTKDAKDVAAQANTTATQIKNASKLPITEVTRRLKRFVRQYGRTTSATYLGTSPQQLGKWIKNGVPLKWHDLVNQVLGRKVDQSPPEGFVRRARPDIEKEILAAIKAVRAWNRKVPRPFQISVVHAEQWAKVGVFPQKFAAAKDAYKKATKKQKPSKRKPPPVIPPPRPILPVPPPVETGVSEKPPAPPRPLPPVPRPRTAEEIASEVKATFIRQRARAATDGRLPRPVSPYDQIHRWALTNRQGVQLYKRVEQFVHEMDLDAFAADVIRIARRIWRFNIGRGVGREIMSIRFTFSVMGSGNPFYPDAFVEGEEISFPTRHVQIYSIDDIVPAIREIISEMYFVDSEVTMLFLEHVEFIKSNKVFVEQT